MTIEIIDKELQSGTPFGSSVWNVEIEITNGLNTYAWNVAVPGTVLENNIQSYLNGIESSLWSQASQVQRQPDTYLRANEKRLLKAFALVVLDEINLLRAEHLLPLRSANQIEGALKNKLKTL